MKTPRIIQHALVRNKRLPFAALSALTDDAWLWAYNVTTPAEVLRSLVKDRTAALQLSLNPNTPADALRELSKSHHPIRLGVAEHPNTQDDIIRTLCADSDPMVRSAARSRVKKLQVP